MTRFVRPYYTIYIFAGTVYNLNKGVGTLSMFEELRVD